MKSELSKNQEPALVQQVPRIVQKCRSLSSAKCETLLYDQDWTTGGSCVALSYFGTNLQLLQFMQLLS